MQSVRIAWESWDDGVPIDPFGSDPTAPDGTYYDFARVIVDYSTQSNTGGSGGGNPDPNDPFTFLEVSVVGGGNYIYTPSRGSLTWKGEGSEENTEIRERDVPISIRQPEVEWVIRWSQLPFSFFNLTLIERLRANLGRVNSEPFKVIFNAPAETILFTGWSMQQQFTWRSGLNGQPPLQLELRFAEKNFISNEGVQVTHNHFYRPSGTTDPVTKAGWRKVLVSTSAGNKYVYEAADLNLIFAP